MGASEGLLVQGRLKIHFVPVKNFTAMFYLPFYTKSTIN